MKKDKLVTIPIVVTLNELIDKMGPKAAEQFVIAHAKEADKKLKNRNK